MITYQNTLHNCGTRGQNQVAINKTVKLYKALLPIVSHLNPVFLQLSPLSSHTTGLQCTALIRISQLKHCTTEILQAVVTMLYNRISPKPVSKQIPTSQHTWSWLV